MWIKFAKLLAATALVTIATAQQLEFTNFPLNLTLYTNQSLALTWQGQDGYVNITLAQFYYFGGGSDFKSIITTFNSGSSLAWTPDVSLQQGVYGFFIASPNRNSSESPFFALVAPNTSSAASPSSSTITSFPSTSSSAPSSGLSDAAKVGLGVGLPLGLIIIACLSYIFWREKSYPFSQNVAISSRHGQRTSQMQDQQVAELEAKRPVYELRAESQT